MSDDKNTTVGEQPLPTEKKTEEPKAATPAKKPAGKTKKSKKKKVAPKKGTLSQNLTTSLSNIKLPKDWNRDKLGDLSGLISSIKDRGQVVPLVVRRGSKPGKYILVDGRRRYAALLKIGISNALIVISEATNDGDAFLESMVANMAREDNTPYERARSFGILVDTYGKTNEEIAKSWGRTPGSVSQYLAVLKADKKLQTALKKGTIALAMFRHFAKLDREQDKVFYEGAMLKAFEGASAQVIGDAIDAYLERQAKKAAAKTEGSAPAKPKAKKGAAAHKPKKNAPKLTIQDYRDPEIVKDIKMIPKKDAIDWLDTYREKALDATTSRKRDYYQGVLEGMEIMTGLLVED